MPLLADIADLQHSGAIVLGAAMASRHLGEFCGYGIDDLVVAATPGNANTGNTLTALASLANHAARGGLPLKTGDVVITGSRISPLPVTGHNVVAVA